MHDERTGDFTAGAALIVAAVASVLAMAHHPVSTHGIGGIGDYVHGAMIVLLSVLFYGFAHYALRRGLRRPAILAGLVAYGVSLAANLGAGLINGYIVPALAARGPEAVSPGIFVLCWEANQALAGLGVFATGAAFILWSLDFLCRTALTNRIIAIIGICAGALPAAALAGGLIDMSVSGALLIYGVHALWACLIGIQFIRRRV